MRGFVLGLVVLAAAQRLLASPSAPGRLRVGGDAISFFVRKIVDPDEPAFGGTRFSQRNQAPPAPAAPVAGAGLNSLFDNGRIPT